jgi:hypothetical protein
MCMRGLHAVAFGSSITVDNFPTRRLRTWQAGRLTGLPACAQGELTRGCARYHTHFAAFTPPVAAQALERFDKET